MTTTTQGASAEPNVLTIPTAIMELPCTRTMSHFATRHEMDAYKEGHRDARHAAADVVLARADELKALAAQPAAPVVPEGYVLMPKVATAKMLLAGGYRASAGGLSATGQTVWAAMLAASPQVEVAQPQTEELTPLDYRAQGREEALTIIMAQDPENPFADHTNSVFGGEDYSTEWDEVALRELLHIGDRKHDAYDRAEAAYWDSQGRKDEAEREMLFVKQAPFYQPLHDFLAKHEAWSLMSDLKRAAAAEVEVAPQAEPHDQAFVDLMPKRAAFLAWAEKRALDVTEDKDAWGNRKFAHSHVQVLWEGWFNAPSTYSAPSEAPQAEQVAKAEPLSERRIEQIGYALRMQAFENAKFRADQGQKMTAPEQDEHKQLVNFARAIESEVRAATPERAAAPADAQEALDAARYRWLRHADLDALAVGNWGTGQVYEGVKFDDAIDRAMAANQAIATRTAEGADKRELVACKHCGGGGFYAHKGDDVMCRVCAGSGAAHQASAPTGNSAGRAESEME